MGGSLGVGVGEDRTTIGGDVLTEFGPQLIELVADVVRNPRFPETEIPRVKANLTRQLALAQSQPQQIALEKFRAVLYQNHPYGRLFPTEAMINGYTVDQIRGFYQHTYGAGRARLYVVGRFDAAAAEAAVRRSFDGWAKGATVSAEPPKPVSTRSIYLIDRPGAPQSTVLIGMPSVDPSHDDFIAMTVMDALLGGAFGSRITKNIREDKGYTYSPFSELSTRYRDTYWAENADVTTAATGPSIKEIFAEIDRLQARAAVGRGAQGDPELPGGYLRAPELEPGRDCRPARVHRPARAPRQLRERVRQAGLRRHATAGQRRRQGAPAGRRRHDCDRRRPQGHRGTGQGIRQNHAVVSNESGPALVQAPMQDIRFALRTLRKQPIFAIVAILTLTLGIGANTAIFSLVYQTLLKPLPYANADRLVFVWNTYPLTGLAQASVSIPDYLDRRTQAAAIEDATLFTTRSISLVAGSQPEQLRALAVTPSFFSTLGRQPMLGRGFTESEATPDADKFVILSNRIWVSRFAADATLIGRDVRLNGEPYRVVGVLPADFDLPSREIAALVPFPFTAQQMSDQGRGNEFSSMIARLRPGATIEQLDAQMKVIVKRNLERLPQYQAFATTSGFGGFAVSIRDQLVGDVRTPLYVLQAGVLVVLLIACVNVANLLLMRATGRYRELAIRTTLGAGQWRLVRQLVTEAIVLAVLGGAGGLALGLAGVRALHRDERAAAARRP